MPELTPRRRAFITKLERDVDAKRADWIKAYRAAVESDDPPALMQPGSKYDQLYKDLVTLREKRNETLARYRSEGYNI